MRLLDSWIDHHNLKGDHLYLSFNLKVLCEVLLETNQRCVHIQCYSPKHIVSILEQYCFLSSLLPCLCDALPHILVHYSHMSISGVVGSIGHLCVCVYTHATQQTPTHTKTAI